ncbi:hypothetical protein WCLP8_1790003 [uncultured Gammaproteobacteria bacterium]
MVINTNLVEVSNGWDYGTECRRTDLAQRLRAMPGVKAVVPAWKAHA